MDWSKYSLSAIRSGLDTDGTRLLDKFAKDVVTKLFIAIPNISCSKCLADYRTKLINLEYKTENEMASKFKLHKKRECISLAFNSRIYVTNANITDEYAKQLIKRFREVDPDFDIKSLFEEFPSDWDSENDSDETTGSNSTDKISENENNIDNKDAILDFSDETDEFDLFVEK